MNITIFGGSGRTGQLLVQQALAAGHHVTAFARTPERLAALASDRLRIVAGDVTDAARVEEAIAGAGAVLSVLGPTSNTPNYRVSQGTAHILAAMRKHGVRRLVVSTGAGVGDAEDSPGLIHRLINLLLRLTARHVYADMQRTVQAVRASQVDWTIVRAPMLTDDPPAGRVNAAYVGKGMGMRVTRPDMAAFMLDQLEDRTYVGKAPAISS